MYLYYYTRRKKKRKVHKICNIHSIAWPRIMKIGLIENRLTLTKLFHKDEILQKKK